MHVSFEPVSRTFEISDGAELPFTIDRQIVCVEVERQDRMPNRTHYDWCPICGKPDGEILIGFVPCGDDFVVGSMSGHGFHGSLHVACALGSIKGDAARRVFMQHYAGIDLVKVDEKQAVKNIG